MLLAYKRVSTLDQALYDRSSLEMQQRAIDSWALWKGLGKFDVQVYTDAGVSGSIALKERPEGGKLYADAKHGDVIIASKLDRLFRDALDAQQCYRDFKARGVDLVLFDMGVEPVTSGGLSKLFFAILSEFAELERLRIAERMQEGKRGKKEKNGHIGGYAPYGFRIEGHGRKATLVPVEREQQILAVVRENRTLKPYRIGKILTEKNLMPRSGAPWDCNQITRMLAREARAG